jgi:hypothetical protein
MATTLAERPWAFVYFNNGVTFLCKSLRVVGAMAQDRSAVSLQLSGMSIINGAQTAGTVAQQELAFYDVNSADVLVTVIQEVDEPERFGDLVTEYRNSQNAVLPEDFVALDDNQENWRRTLRAAGVTYIYKPSVTDPRTLGSMFTAQEAARCLAAMTLEGARIARVTPEKLWERQQDCAGAPVTDIRNSIYGTTFPDSLTARRLWRTVQIARLVCEAIEAEASSQAESDPHGAAILNEGVLFALHLIFLRRRDLLDGRTLGLTTDERQQLSREIEATRLAFAEAFKNEAWGDLTASQVLADLGNLQTLKGRALRTLQGAARQ